MTCVRGRCAENACNKVIHAVTGNSPWERGLWLVLHRDMDRALDTETGSVTGTVLMSDVSGGRAWLRNNMLRSDFR